MEKKFLILDKNQTIRLPQNIYFHVYCDVFDANVPSVNNGYAITFLL